MSDSDSRIVICPHCTTKYRVEAASDGARFKCKRCLKDIVVNTHTETKEEKYELRPGDELGKYIIIEKIGQGGMGTVYKAKSKTSDRHVAVKTLMSDKSTARNDEKVRRFLREARLAAALVHEHIVRTWAVVEKGGYYHIVLEYLAEGTVKTYMQEKGTFSEKKTIEISKACCKALIEAAKLHVVHRDIKPDNIMLDDSGGVKLADLGLATQSRESFDEHSTTASFAANNFDSLADTESTELSLTMSNVAMGTPAYMAPEQAADSRNVDGRADIYSMGATMYHMLCGEPPYMAKKLQEVLMMHRNDPIPDPREMHEGLSAHMARIIMKCLAKKPADRFQSPNELLEELEIAAREFIPTHEQTELVGQKVVFFESDNVHSLPGNLIYPPFFKRAIHTIDRAFSRKNLTFILLFLILAVLVSGVYVFKKRFGESEKKTKKSSQKTAVRQSFKRR